MFFREEDESLFRQNMFKVLCGTKPYSEKIKARRYKVQEQYLSKEDFTFIMRNLPEKVSDCDINEMFARADEDEDGKISWTEFQMMATLPERGRWATSTSSTSAISCIPLSVSDLSRRAPRDISETHVLTGWDKIGLVRPSPSPAVATVNMHHRVVFKD